jgi:hypothetical protein
MAVRPFSYGIGVSLQVRWVMFFYLHELKSTTDIHLAYVDKTKLKAIIVVPDEDY